MRGEQRGVGDIVSRWMLKSPMKMQIFQFTRNQQDISNISWVGTLILGITVYESKK